MQRLIMSLFCLLPFSLSAQTLQFVGTAFAPESRQPIYTERYTEHFSADGKLVTGTVLYREYDGATLGEKFLDYAHHPYAPAFEFTNVKTGYQESVRWLPDGKVRLAHREPGQDEQEKVMSVPEPAVADAGFNQFMRDHITALKNGETLEFNFLNPARLTWFRFYRAPYRADRRQHHRRHRAREHRAALAGGADRTCLQRARGPPAALSRAYQYQSQRQQDHQRPHRL